MAQSNLRLTQRSIRDEAAAEANFPADETTWSTIQQTEMLRVMKRAMRWVFQPEILPGEFTPHLWSWLKPVSTIDIWGTQSPTSGATITPDTSSASVTSAGSTFYASMVGKEIVAYSDDGLDTEIGTVGTIASISGSTLTLTANAAYGNGVTNYRWGIVSDGSFRMPVEFCGMDGEIYFSTGDRRDRLRKVNEDQILDWYQHYDSSGTPCKFAVRPVAGYDGTAEQAWELILAPIPDAHYTLKYRMHLNVDAITSVDGSTGDKYLPGGSVYTELFRASALAAVESIIFRTRGVRYEEAIKALQSAVHFDRAHTMPDELGEMRARRPLRRTNSWYDDVNGPDVFINGDQMFL